MNTYTKHLSLDSGVAFARALQVYLGLGDPLVALQIAGNVAACTFVQAGATRPLTDDSVNDARLTARVPALTPN